MCLCVIDIPAKRSGNEKEKETKGKRQPVLYVIKTKAKLYTIAFGVEV